MSRFGVLDAPSPKKLGLAGGGVCTLDEPDGFLVDIGADIDGLRLAALNGRPSSESLSPLEPPTQLEICHKINHPVADHIEIISANAFMLNNWFYIQIRFLYIPCGKHCP